MLKPQLRAPGRLLEGILTQASNNIYRAPEQLSQRRFPSNPFTSSLSRSQLYQHQLSSILPRFNQVRYASHNSQGSGANKHSANRPGRRLGAKKTGGQYVVPGNIIFKQRGTKWFPGENCGMGRDHTIHAEVAGYVQYYKDPYRHPTRQFIGVVFEKGDKLPTPRNAKTRRRLNMVAVPRQPSEEAPVVDMGELSQAPGKLNISLVASKAPTGYMSGYMHREANWEIGRAAEKAGITVPEWRRNDRWTAWKKKLEKIKRIAQMKDLKKQKKTKSKN
ncbi:54S ribosomal protein L2 mitochondrial [Myotisia sp. PD_48]|nr:54S ribosomal protein L2 mitochondrial [Myotisia sp. PD_48]